MKLQALLISVCLAASACGGGAPLTDQSSTYGPKPVLPPPQTGGLVPTIKVAEAVGWPEGAAPTAPAGFTVTRFASGLSHPRWMKLLPNGDILVAEAATTRSRGGLTAAARNAIQERAGAIEDEGGNRIVLLRDGDGDGDVDEKHVLITGLNQPFGMELIGAHLYIANTDAVYRYPYEENATRISGQGERILSLPYNEGANGHWTRDLLAKPDGSKLYVSVGSVSNIPENEDAFPLETRRANILEFNPDGTGERVFAAGLRNPNGLAWEPVSGALWVAVNERDGLGDDLVPDYMTSVRDGAFYGWPYSYFGQHLDPRVEPQNPELVSRALAPDYALGAHTASLGLAFYTANRFPEHYRGGVFIGQHGSWNRSELVGYKVIFVPFANGAPNGAHEDFLTGFLNDRGEAQGRPVGVAVDRTGALLVADDVGGIIWRVARAS
ncbi:MAG: sorbosone dehydrogenase family protein [Caulobacterales bacterium]